MKIVLKQLIKFYIKTKCEKSFVKVVKELKYIFDIFLNFRIKKKIFTPLIK